MPIGIVAGLVTVFLAALTVTPAKNPRARAEDRVAPYVKSLGAVCTNQRERQRVRIVRADAAKARAVITLYDGTARAAHVIGQATLTLKRANTLVAVRLRGSSSLLSDCAVRFGRTLTIVVRITPHAGRAYAIRTTVVGVPTQADSSSTPTSTTPVSSSTATEPAAPVVAEPVRAVASSRRSLGSVGAPITEASGLAWSRTNAATWWTHNDSGDSARLFALDSAARIHVILPLAGAVAVDWEDIATGPGPTADSAYLYAADIGDNAAIRASVRVYRVLEPDLTGVATGTMLPAANPGTVVLQYPDGARDAESLLVDQKSGDLYVISKREARVRVYRASSPVFSGETLTMQYVATLDQTWVVAADVCADNATVLVKDTAHIYAYVSDTSIATAFAQQPTARLYSAEPQGEAVAANPTCTGYATLSEGSNQPLLVYEP